MRSENFSIILPAQISKSKGDSWRIRGLASTENIDRQGEILLQSGMDLTPIDRGVGSINWEHGEKPEDQIGLLDGYSKENGKVFLEGRLFKKHDRAKAVKQILDSLEDGDVGRLGLSVQGQIVQRNGINDKIVEKCIIDSVAVTLKPVNSDTHVSLIKSMIASDFEFTKTKTSSTYTSDQVAELMVKALSIGAGSTAAPDTRTGGDALVVENFGSKKKKKKEPIQIQKGEEGYEFKIEKILTQLQDLYPNESRDTLWSALKERLNQSMS